MENLREDVLAAARADAKVLIVGETGVGKEVVARLIHESGRRRGRSFVTINCAGLPDSLLESELFGHVRGSFTGAYRDKPGLAAMAHNGTLFLDELGEMSLRMQALLLRFLETGEIQRVGSERIEGRLDVRVIAATNRNLTERIECREFREDLFYRLQVMPITLPPLRDRKGDVPLLASYFVDRYNREFKRRVHGLSAAALTVVDQYAWPGNIRELRNAIERAMLLTTGQSIEPADLTSLTHKAEAAQFQLPPDGVSLEEVERQLLTQALERTGGNQTQAAQLLGINRDQVRYRIEKFGLQTT